MPTFETAAHFKRDFKRLSPEDKKRFEEVIQTKFVPDVVAGQFRPGLRVKPMQGVSVPAGQSPIMEMTWAPDGRATWQFGAQVRDDETHIVWRRVGGHEIFDPGPP
ncbi:hypothetical protein [Streptomyces montanisoli]|uniref:Uncharacterized protein n=1 Tax=Streptomyces montanisoli TaxID=2798581 RepID=A0A940ME00_9ACTN|nr:hypothetical protein [Streptomyces montanisoli]MBP0458621.1 hypothetical protein [Streptomyces montanisoli]